MTAYAPATLGRCKTCGARIAWVKTEATGKSMPLDAESVPDGNVVLRGGRAHVFALGGAEEAAVAATHVPRFVSHFSTCRDADEHRRAR